MTGWPVVRAHLRMTVDVRRLLTVICAGIEPRWQFRIAITLFTRHGPHFVEIRFGRFPANVSPSRYTANRSIHAAGSEIRSQIHVRSEMHSVDTVKVSRKDPR